MNLTLLISSEIRIRFLVVPLSHFFKFEVATHQSTMKTITLFCGKRFNGEGLVEYFVIPRSIIMVEIGIVTHL